MNNRQEAILQSLLEKYIRTGQPISSGLIAQELNISSATVRNELTALEEQGYIRQPHTSAGRLPTEAAYRWLLGRAQAVDLPGDWLASLSLQLGDLSEMSFKQTAKVVAELSGLAVFWVFHRHHVYYTGLTNLLSQPEFVKTDLVCHISQIIDHLDEIVDEVFPQIAFEPQIMLGQSNPFGAFAGTVLTKYRHHDQVGMIGILGPVRMNYEQAKMIIESLLEHIEQAQPRKLLSEPAEV